MAKCTSPRHYMDRFVMAKGDPEEQDRIRAECPQEWRELVRAHIRINESLEIRRQAKKESKR